MDRRELSLLLRSWSDVNPHKTKAEISAVNHLQKLYEVLTENSLHGKGIVTSATAPPAFSPANTRRRPQSARDFGSRGDGSISKTLSLSSSVAAIRSLRQQQLNAKAANSPLSRGRQLMISSPSCLFEQWMTLQAIAVQIARERVELEREIDGSDRKCRELADHTHARLTLHSSTLTPKLRCLQEVLGRAAFHSYWKDLWREVAQLRRRTRLYGRRWSSYVQQLRACPEKTVSRDQCRTILNELLNPMSDSIEANDEVILLSHCPVLLQHCADSRDPERTVLADVLHLLSSLPTERGTLLQHFFERIADPRRGEGPRPPPDAIKAFKLLALIKQSHSDGLCSRDEFLECSTWLESCAKTEDVVTTDQFAQLHHAKSDEFWEEDADFLAFLLRMWRVDIAVDSPGDGIYGADDAVLVQILQNRQLRSQHRTSINRKTALLGKIQSALTHHESYQRDLQTRVSELRALCIESPRVSQWMEQGGHAMTTAVTHCCRHLAKLSLASQCLREFPHWITRLPVLEDLDLRDNRIRSLPPELDQLKSLRRLVLSENALDDAAFVSSDMPTWLKMSELEDLDLSRNALTTLPMAVTELPKLRVLRIAHNSLRVLPVVVLKQWEYRKCALQTFDLQHNAITSIPEELALFTKCSLQRLLLHGNKLKCLPTSSMTAMAHLKELTLSNNDLGIEMQSYPLTIATEAITLDQNKLERFPAMELSLPKQKTTNSADEQELELQVRRISARCNRLRAVPVESAWPTFALCEELYLDHNALSELPELLFLVLPKLRMCDLSNNRLHTLPESIAACRWLETLDVHQNRLTSLPVDLNQLDRLVTLNAVDNRLSSIPIEWYSFALHRDARTDRRPLQTLALKKNPMEDPVLKKIVDQRLAHESHSTGDPLGHLLKKLLEAVNEPAVAHAIEREWERVWASDDDEDAPQQRRWNGSTQQVAKWLERRLRRAQNQQSGSLDLLETEFGRFLKTLPAKWSKKEIAWLSRRFSRIETAGTSADDKAARSVVDGRAFLQGLEALGHRKTISHAREDSVAPILQYLQLKHAQQQRLEHDHCTAAAKGEPERLKHQAKPKKTPLSPAKKAHNGPKTKPLAAKFDAVGPVKTPKKRTEDPVVRRQRQRIQILEQQLLDQHLLQLNQRRSSHEPLEPAEDDPSDSPLARADTISVRIQCLTPHAISSSSGRLELSIPRDATVLQLKQAICGQCNVPVHKQVLVARASRSGHSHSVRLSDEAAVLAHAAGSLSVLRLALLVGESLSPLW